MKFLETLIGKYDKYKLEVPADLKEGANSIPATGSTSTSTAYTSPVKTTNPMVGKPVTDITSLTNDPETLKIKGETDQLLKQIATLMKKQAMDVLNKTRAANQ